MIFFWRGSVILCVERLRHFCVWRGCVIFVCGEVVGFFLTNSLRLHDFFSGGSVCFFSRRFCVIFFERLHDFLLCRACIIFLCSLPISDFF